MGGAQGIPLEKMEAMRDPRSSAALDEREKLVAEYVEAMCRTPVDVSDELFARLRQAFDDAALVELTTLVAWENFRARFNRALAIESDGLSEKSVCLIPARSPAASGATAA